jgi:hypothetical protein
MQKVSREVQQLIMDDYERCKCAEYAEWKRQQIAAEPQQNTAKPDEYCG